MTTPDDPLAATARVLHGEAIVIDALDVSLALELVKTPYVAGISNVAQTPNVSEGLLRATAPPPSSSPGPGPRRNRDG